MDKQDNKAVILGSNYYIGLSTIRCLGARGVHTVAIDYEGTIPYGASSRYCAERVTAPHYKSDPKQFVQFLIDYAKRQSSPPVLIPCHDSYVEVIDAFLPKLKAYYLIPQTEQGLYTKLMNKETLEQLAAEVGIPVPEVVRVDEPDYVDKVERDLKFPCLVKPTDSPPFMSHFHQKLFKVFNRDELVAAVARAQQAGFEVIVQRIVPGFDDHMYTYDAYLNQEGKVVQWVTCQKLRQLPINFGASVYTTQRYVPELHDIGARFLEAIGYKGFAEIEFKKDADTGTFYLIEVNARITSLNTLLEKVGMNVPYITWLELTGGSVEPFVQRQDTRVTFRYLYEDLLAIRDYMRTGQLSLGQVLQSLRRPKAPAVWDWRDPKPGFVYAGAMLSTIMKRKLKRG